MKKLIQYISAIALLLLVCNLSAQQVVKSEYGSFALTNATIQTVTNGTVTGTVLVQDGKITGVGQVQIPSDAETIDCSGLTIYPGMIDGGTALGMVEVSSVSLTNDSREIGDFTPHAQALTAVNPSSALIAVSRVDGVTTVLTQPSGGRFPGTAALINLHGYTPDQMYAGFKAVRLIFPSSGRRSRWDRRSEEDIKKEEEKATKKLNELWEKCELHEKIATAHAAGKGDAPEYNPDLDAMLPVMRGEMHLLVEVNKSNDIKTALNWIKEKGIKAILTGVSEGYRVTDEILESGIPVITGPVITVPGRSSDKYDAAYANAGKMAKAGIKVAIRSNDSENVRNLPWHAGFAVAYGMDKMEALKAVTINPAEIFGVGDQLGSIEVGKMANLVVTDGDLFETKTNVKHLFISGWNVPIESRHTLLYNEFLNRAPGVQK